MTDSKTNNRGVLVIYTGGTIGSRPRDVDDPESPQVVVDWAALEEGTPELKLLGRRFQIDHYSIDPLDSCNVGPKEWQQIARVVFDKHDQYEGFVVLHGTDTMVYTGSALSFMLQNLKKPVIFTGAQRSALVDIRNDATQNLLTAIELANPSYYNRPPLPEVCIYFGGKLMRANRTVKRDTSGYDAYESPNYPVLALVGDNVDYSPAFILPVPRQPLRLRSRLETGVTTVHVYPGIQHTEIVQKQLLESPNLKGAIVLGYGSGNLPSLWPDWLETFRTARNKEVLLLEVSQCRRGPVELGIYETSAMLLVYGFIACHDLTLEAALTKMQVILADQDLTFNEKVGEFLVSLAGEQSVSTYVSPILKETSLIDGRNPFLRLPARAIQGDWDDARSIKTVVLRLRGVKLSTTEKSKGNPAPVRFHAYLDIGGIDEAATSHPGYCGMYRKEPSELSILTFDVTETYRTLAKPGQRLSVSLQLDSSHGVLSFEEAEFVLQVNR